MMSLIRRSACREWWFITVRLEPVGLEMEERRRDRLDAAFRTGDGGGCLDARIVKGGSVRLCKSRIIQRRYRSS